MSKRFLICRTLTVMLAALFAALPCGTLHTHAGGRTVLLGGFPIGLRLDTGGVLVVAMAQINTAVGYAYPQTEVQAGDVIVKIEDTSIGCVADVSGAIEGVEKDTLTLAVLREGRRIELKSKPLLEDLTGERRLGFAVKDSVTGVGTVTFFTPDGRFACLGHPICDGVTGRAAPCDGGEALGCDIVGLSKGSRGKAGELKGVISGKAIGQLAENCAFGIYGKLSQPPSAESVPVCPRQEVRSGGAKIVCAPCGTVQEFDIEIIKATHQQQPSEKGLVIRVTDRRLLKLTGGILQGMSGSPIMQDGKIVGAVTHVFVGDPTKGYGVYADFMLDRLLSA